jgi:hypothetical protein
MRRAVSGQSGLGEIFSPVFAGGFGNLLDYGVAFVEERLHVAAEDKGLRNATEQGDGRGEAEDVMHGGEWGRAVGEDRLEVMIVLHGVEGAVDHGVLEAVRRVVRGDPAGEALADEEMACLPGDGVAEGEQARGGVAGPRAWSRGQRNGRFAEVDVAGEVDFDGAGEVETAFDRSGDQGGFGESDHGPFRMAF